MAIEIRELNTGTREFATEIMEWEGPVNPAQFRTNGHVIFKRNESADMVSEGAPADGRTQERIITDPVQSELRVAAVQEALVWIGEIRAERGERPLGKGIRASVLGKTDRRIFDGVADQVTHRPPAARQKPR